MLVWDLPTRLFHWLLVLLFGFSWWSAENRELEWHALSGLALLGLLVFRLIWGFIGGSTARFATFVRGPGAALRYLRGDGQSPVGHNPLGAYSVIAMLLLLAVQIATGLFSTDVDGLDSGPLNFLVTFEQGRAAAEVHEGIFNLLLALVGLHILAVLFYRMVRKRNLVRPMITGRDPALDGAGGGLRAASPWAFAVAVAIGAFAAWATNKGFWLLG